MSATATKTRTVKQIQRDVERLKLKIGKTSEVLASQRAVMNKLKDELAEARKAAAN